MGDMGELYNDWKAHKKALRASYGRRCPHCTLLQPKREPTVLLPGQRCKVDGYRDPRPPLTDAQREAACG